MSQTISQEKLMASVYYSTKVCFLIARPKRSVASSDNDVVQLTRIALSAIITVLRYLDFHHLLILRHGSAPWSIAVVHDLPINEDNVCTQAQWIGQ